MKQIFESYEEIALISLFLFRNYVPPVLLTLSLSLPLLKFIYRHLHKQLVTDLDAAPNNNFEKFSHLLNIPQDKKHEPTI